MCKTILSVLCDDLSLGIATKRVSIWSWAKAGRWEIDVSTSEEKQPMAATAMMDVV